MLYSFETHLQQKNNTKKTFQIIFSSKILQDFLQFQFFLFANIENLPKQSSQTSFFIPSVL